MNKLEQVSQRLEEQVSLVEKSLSRNSQLLEDMALLANRRIRKIRRELPLSSINWERRLLETINMLGEIERLIEKMEDIVVVEPPVEKISLERLMELNAEAIF